VIFAGSAPKKSADESYPFSPNRNFYYLTGIDRKNPILVLIKTSSKVEEMLFIEKSDPVFARWYGEKMKPEEAIESSGIEDIRYLDTFEDRINFFITRSDVQNIYFDMERDSWGDLVTYPQEFAAQVMKRYPSVIIKNVYASICHLRGLKTTEEIDTMRKAIDITRMGINSMMEHARPGMMEYEIESWFNQTLTANGVRDFAFKTIAAAGMNGTVLHYSSNTCRCGESDLILCDLGAEWQYYKADITRTFPVSGKFTEKQKQVYNIVLKANEMVIKTAKAGVTKSELEAAAQRVLADGCKELGLIKEDKELRNYYFHSIGHPLGLDTHDVKDGRAALEAGTVYTDEPGLYIPEWGIGVRIEDDILITEDGCEVLSKDIIKTVDEIEKFMKNR
jgi:Xaa-Pro aminopeptidase